MRTHKMYNYGKWLAIVTVFLAGVDAYGHIKNEATQFPDIEYSDSRFDIVVLVGAGIIPETPVFEPDQTLSKSDLAAWAALADGLLRGGETPDVNALSAAALSAGLTDSLDGDATVGDLNNIFFDGQLGIDEPQRTISKAQAATLIANTLGTELGKPLLTKRGLRPGATGKVMSVDLVEGHHGNAYVLTIGNTAWSMDEHGRVANGPNDLLQWEGRTVRRSFVRGRDDNSKWIFLEAEPRDAPLVDVAPQALGETVTPATEPAEPASNRRILFLLLGAVVILALVLFFRRRRSA